MTLTAKFKKLILIILSVSVLLTFNGCSGEADKFTKADDTAYAFASAFILNDAEAMKKYAHPDYAEAVLPTEEYYDYLETAFFFSVGATLDGMVAVAKDYIEGTGVEGELIKCYYVIDTNSLLYKYEAVILDNDAGYGIYDFYITINEDQGV